MLLSDVFKCSQKRSGMMVIFMDVQIIIQAVGNAGSAFTYINDFLWICKEDRLVFAFYLIENWKGSVQSYTSIRSKRTYNFLISAQCVVDDKRIV